MLTGRADRAVALERQALASVDRAAEPLRAGALLERLGRYQWMNGDSEGARASLEQALVAVPAEPASRERARALAADGQLLMLGSRNQEAVARCQEAVARQVGARAEEGHALNSLGVALEGLGRFDEGMARLREARRIVEESSATPRSCARSTTTSPTPSSARAGPRPLWPRRCWPARWPTRSAPL